MTDSNLIASLQNQENVDNNQPVDPLQTEQVTDNNESINPVDINQEPITNSYKNKDSNDNQQFLDFGKFDFDDSANTFLFDGNESYDFSSQEFDIGTNIFNDLTEEKPQQNLSGLAKGLGIEIGAGLSADVILAPLLATGPLGIAAYGGGQFAIGYYANIQAQKARGVKEISQAEAIAAGLIQIIPAGAAGKGLKGIRQGAIYGAGFSVGETFLRDLLGDDVSRDEYLLSLGFGSAFGASFKGSLQGLEGIFSKIKGKTNIEADAILTKQDKKTINDAVKNIDTVSKKQKQKLKQEGLDTDKLDDQINKQKQKSTDNVVAETSTEQILTFTAPPKYAKTKPRYGSGSLIFESDFDKLAWSLRSKRVNKARNDSEYLQVFINQGFSENQVRVHGDKVHTKIKQIVKDLTGSASAGDNNPKLKGLNIEIPVLSEFSNKIQTKLNKIPSKKNAVDLGNRQLNPQKMSMLGDLKPESKKLVEDKIKFKKDAGGFAGAERKTFAETQEGALSKMVDEEGKISIDEENMEFFNLYTQQKAFIEGKLPTDEEVTINRQSLRIATERVGKTGQSIIDAIKKTAGSMTDADKELRRNAVKEYSKAQREVDNWLSRGVLAQLRVSRGMKALQIEPIGGIEGKKPAEIMKMTPAQKKQASKITSDISPNLQRLLDAGEDLENRLLAALEKGDETGDYSGLIKTATESVEAAGDPMNMVKLQGTGGVGKFLENASYTSRVINEIGINGVLSGPPTQRINFESGLYKTFLEALENFVGALDAEGGSMMIRPEGLEAAKRHFFALFYNMDFGLRTWKRSFDMEDNFINVGNSKVDTGRRFVISSDEQGNFGKLIDRGRKKFNLISDEQPYIPFNATNAAGKGIRLPSRLMTANDALIQTPNIIAASAFEATVEGMRRGLKDQDLNDYIKGHVDGIIQYLIKGQEGPLGRLKPLEGDTFFRKGVGPREFIDDPFTAKILERSKNFGKQITFTQDIRGSAKDTVTDLLGLSAQAVNDLAIKYPPVRTMFKFTKTPTNMIKDVMRYIPFANIPLRFGGQTNYNPYLSYILPEILADLRSPDPLIRQNTRGGIILSNAIGTVLSIAAYNNILKPVNEFISSSEYEDMDRIPKTIVTGGGPNYYTEEGAAKWISLNKNGWLPYSRGFLMYDEEGQIMFGDDGLPKYLYKSYEGLAEPALSLVKLWVDFHQMSEYIEDENLFEQFVYFWNIVVGRNLTNKTYLQQFSDTVDLFAAAPEIGKNVDPDENLNYGARKFINYTGRLVTSSVIPYSSLLDDLNRLPSNLISHIFQIDEREAQRLLKEGDEGFIKLFGNIPEILGQPELGKIPKSTIIKYFAKLDTSIYSGDTTDLVRNIKNLRFLSKQDDLDFTDLDYNEANAAIQILSSIIDQARDVVPRNVGGNLPIQTEHITDDVITHPQRQARYDLFSNAKYSMSKNNPIYQAQYLIGKLLPPPSDVIRGSKLKNFVNDPRFKSDLFVPIKLDKTQYALLKRYINNVPIEYSGKSYTLQTALNAYLKGKLKPPVKRGFATQDFRYDINKEVIEKRGLRSGKGQIAAKNIYYSLNKLNREFILRGTEEYLKNEFSIEELKNRIKAKTDLQESYNNEVDSLVNQLNPNRF